MDEILNNIQDIIYGFVANENSWVQGIIDQQTYISKREGFVSGLASLFTDESSNNPTDISQIVDAISANTNDIVGNLADYVTEVKDAIVYYLNKQLNGLTYMTTNNFNATTSQLTSLGSMIANGVNTIIGNIDSRLNNSTETILQGLNNSNGVIAGQIQQGIGLLDNELRYTQSNVINRLDNNTQTILKAVARITGTTEIINQDDLSTSDKIAWINTFLSTLSKLNINIQDIEDILRYFKTNPIIVETTVTQDNNNTGNTNNSASTGNLGFDLGQQLAGLLSGNQDLLNSASSFSAIYNKLIAGEYINANDLIADMKSITISGGLLSTLLNIIQGVIIITSGLYKFSTPFTNNIETLARTVALDNLLPQNVLTELYIRKLIDYEEFKTGFNRLGYDESDFSKFALAATQQLQDFYLREAYLREFISETQHDNGMIQLGYQSSDLPLIKKLYSRLPPIPDLIRFAVREAYNIPLAESIGYTAEYDAIKEQFERDIKAQGLEPEFGLRYWIAHWNLPSATQAYEMLHRGIIEQTDLEQLLKVQDYPELWRQRLIDVAYSPYTRVDIRRMHKENVLSADEVKRAYMDIGYNEDKAQHLTEFTIKINDSEKKEVNRELTQSVILRAYVNGILTESESRLRLENLGYDNTEQNILFEIAKLSNDTDSKVDVIKDNNRRIINTVSKSYIEGTLSKADSIKYLTLAGYDNDMINNELKTLDIERDIATRQEELDIIQKAYLNYQDTKNNTSDKLSSKGFAPDEISKLMRLWDNARVDLNKIPSLTDLKKMLEGNIIDINDLQFALLGNGYSQFWVDKYIELLT